MEYHIFGDFIKNKRKDSVFFCMPSHNGEGIGIDTSLDITELSFSDNLQSPSGIIAELECRIAASCHSNYALVYTAGATSAILSALAAAKAHGNTIAVGGNTHKSVYALANLIGLKVINTPDFQRVNANNQMTHGDKLAAVVFTSPDYYGMTYDISAARSLACDHNAILVCDQSHGSHFAFSSLLPTPNDNIADITINSWHKTLPVLGGGAVATCNSTPLHNQLLMARADTHTTSPSYMVISSIDYANNLMTAQGGALYTDIYAALQHFVAKLPTGCRHIHSDDFTRLVLSVAPFSAASVASQLESQGIFIEMTYGDRLVLIVSPLNYQHLPRLLGALCVADLSPTCTTPRVDISPTCTTPRVDISPTSTTPRVDLSPACTTPRVDISPTSTALLHLDLLDCVGYVSAVNVGIYPPGTPIIKQGDTITPTQINELMLNHNQIFGLSSGKIICHRRK